MLCLKLTTLFALPLAFALTLGAAPQEAWAGACAHISGVPNKKCVEKKDIAKNAIVSNRVKNESLTGVDILNGSIGMSDLGADSVGGSEIAAGAVGASELAIDAKPAGADFAEGNQNFPLPAGDTVLRSVALTAPAPGVVIVNGTVTMFFGAGGGFVACSLTTGLVIVSAALVQQGNAATGTESVALTRGFEVGAGTTTFNLVCEEFSGSVVARDSILTALYVPQRS